MLGIFNKSWEVERKITGLMPEEIFGAWSDRSYAFWLDTAYPKGEWGRYSYIGWEPFLIVRAYDGTVEIDLEGKKSKLHVNNALSFLSRLIKEGVLSEENLKKYAVAVGYFAYDYGLKLNGISLIENKSRVFCYDYEFAFYDFLIAYDHLESLYFFVHTSDAGKQKIAEVQKFLKRNQAFSICPKKASECSVKLRSVFSREEYEHAVRKIKEKIRDGYVYVVNLANQFKFAADVNGFQLYLKIRKQSPTDYSAYMNFGDTLVLSASPECFLKIRGSRIFTKPIKGTVKRSKNPVEDDMLKNELKNNQKERVELAMVVDLERNDLAKICRPGSVRVVKFAEIETYRHLHHLIGIVEGEMIPETNLEQIIGAVFPGGSITGAPKIAAMNLIEQLEGFNRGLYTGSLGFFLPGGQGDLNIMIRTLIGHGDQWYFGVGSGITIESLEPMEYEETLLKAKFLFKSLGFQDP